MSLQLHCQGQNTVQCNGVQQKEQHLAHSGHLAKQFAECLLYSKVAQNPFDSAGVVPGVNTVFDEGKMEFRRAWNVE